MNISECKNYKTLFNHNTSSSSCNVYPAVANACVTVVTLMVQYTSTIIFGVQFNSRNADEKVY